MKLIQRSIALVGAGIISLSMFAGIATAEGVPAEIDVTCTQASTASIAGELDFGTLDVSTGIHTASTSDGAIEITAVAPCEIGWRVWADWGNLTNGSHSIDDSSLALEGTGAVRTPISTIYTGGGSPWFGQDTATVGHKMTISAFSWTGTYVGKYRGVLNNIAVVPTGTYTTTVTVTFDAMN